MSSATAAKSSLGMFVDKLLAFFEDLVETYPEEKEIRYAVDAITMAKKMNPRLVLDMFVDYVSKPLHDSILSENEEVVIPYAKNQIQNQFNEMSPALLIFDKHWPAMSEANRKAIWNHMKVLILLSDKAMTRF
jgi:hypothetical protein